MTTTAAVKTSLKKGTLSSFKLNCVYLDPLNMQASWSWILKDFIQVQKEEGKFVGRMSTSSIKLQIRRFHVVVERWTPKKCTRTAWCTCRAVVLDGPLEKLWGGGEGEFSSCRNYFSLSNSLCEYFLGLIGVQEFFAFNFSLRGYFFVLRPPPPPPHPNKFSNGPCKR